ncbi:hypothetical protein BJV82DRAFT_669874 [Fennellomyces sp. T-0311]|nr:hypothetical protein BJV82DRAFT_669874 [Fennellomyces sp. T-0311]
MASFIPFAVLSGVFASLSSVFAKLFSDTRTELLHDAITSFIIEQGIPYTVDPQASLLALRAVCFGLIFVCNSLMWTLFTKSLNAAPSSVQATTVNGAMNFSVSVTIKKTLLMFTRGDTDGNNTISGTSWVSGIR